MDSKSGYYYDAETDSTYSCGVKWIDESEQLSLIEHALNTIDPQLKEVSEKYASNYEKYSDAYDGVGNVPVSGFCKNKHHPERHSEIPFVKHNCKNCLAKYLVEHRKTIWSEVAIKFEASGSSCVDVNKIWKSGIKISFNKGIARLTLSDETKYDIHDFSLDIRTGQCPLFVIKEDILHEEKIIIGEINGIVKGIPVCRSLLWGEQCRGMQNRNQNKFTSLCVPKGYPNWTENVKIGSAFGDVFIYPLCLMDNYAEGPQSNSKSPSSKPEYYSPIERSRTPVGTKSIRSPKSYKDAIGVSSKQVELEEQIKKLQEMENERLKTEIKTLRELANMYKQQVEVFLKSESRREDQINSLMEENKHLRNQLAQNQFPNRKKSKFDFGQGTSYGTPSKIW